jgi:hypothetical protein
MKKIRFGPLVTQQRLSPKETKYFLDRFQQRENKFNIKTDLPDLHERGRIDDKDPIYNQILDPYIKNHLNEANWKGEYNLISLWGNVYRDGDFIPPHIHDYCDLSFVIILKMPPPELLNSEKKEGELSLMWGYSAPFFQKIKHVNTHQFLPKIGELIIFPQNLIHYTLPMKHPQAERISLSGNILLN